MSHYTAPLQLYGELGIDFDQGPVDQITTALRLPIAVRGVLAPDAHLGYGLPIGGVFAAHDAVAPYMVGVDIGCRMHCSVFALSPDTFRAGRAELFAALGRVTVFGAGKQGLQKDTVAHPILGDSRWDETPVLRPLRAVVDKEIGW